MNQHVTIPANDADALPVRIRDDQPVLPSVPEVIASFGEDEWDLSPADHHDGREDNVTTISFVWITRPEWKLAAKELAYHRLNTRLSATQRQISPYTCAREQIRLKRFIRWLEKYHPRVASPAQLSQIIVHAYHMWLKSHDDDEGLDGVAGGNKREAGTTIGGDTIWTYMSPIKSLDVYRDHLNAPMPFRPYGGKLNAKMCGFDSSGVENSTPPIPDEVLHPLISTAVRYVEHYHRDIRNMVRDVLAFWQQVDVDRSPWPGWTASIGQCPDLNKPWRPPLGLAEHHVNHEFRAEISHLIAACAVVILYLSGMRPGEFARLRVDCLRRTIDPNTGEVVRWKIRGFPLKKRKGKVHKEVDWVVPKAAAEAVQVLQEVLQPFRDRHGSRHLALNLDAFQPYPEKDKRGGYGITERSLRGRLLNFVEMISKRYETPISYQLMPSQFRRTLARHIARQPFGIIAGKLHYNHVKTSIFEGYAGSSDDGFRLEVADEELLAHVDLLEEMQQDADEGQLFGPGASALLRDYQNAKRSAVGEAQIDTSSGQIALGAALKSLAKRIHVGMLNFCIFSAEKAACLTEKEAREQDAQPKINQCSPDQCGNSVVGACHVPLWKGLLDEVEELQKSAPRSGPQRASLTEQAKRYRRVISGVANA